MLMTNLFDDSNAQLAGEYLRNVSGRHLPLAVFMRDHDLFGTWPTEPARKAPACSQGAAAASMLNWRERSPGRLAAGGRPTIDALPQRARRPSSSIAISRSKPGTCSDKRDFRLE